MVGVINPESVFEFFRPFSYFFPGHYLPLHSTADDIENYANEASKTSGSKTPAGIQGGTFGAAQSSAATSSAAPSSAAPSSAAVASSSAAASSSAVPSVTPATGDAGKKTINGVGRFISIGALAYLFF
jgi:hypothetical protein